MTNIIAFIFWEEGFLSAYSFDTGTNIFCMWLTFKFSQKYFDNIFCGKYCTKCMFPWIKMYALTCCSSCYDYNKEELSISVINETKIHDSHSIIGCCHKTTLQERKRVLQLSQREYTLLIVRKN